MSDRNHLVGLLCLAIIGILATGGAVFLSYAGRAVPEPLTALAGVAVGSLATFARVTNGKPPQ